MIKTRFLLLCIASVMLCTLFSGCKKDLKDFSFQYSMESVDNYKLVVAINSNKSYKIEEYNYYMDNQANKREPIILEGTLTDEEFDEAKKVLGKCDFFGMKDSYGFDKEADGGVGNIIYQVSFKENNESKLISIRDSKTNQFPSSFVKLIGYINTFLNTHKKDSK